MSETIPKTQYIFQLHYYRIYLILRTQNSRCCFLIRKARSAVSLILAPCEYGEPHKAISALAEIPAELVLLKISSLRLLKQIQILLKSNWQLRGEGPSPGHNSARLEILARFQTG